MNGSDKYLVRIFDLDGKEQGKLFIDNDPIPLVVVLISAILAGGILFYCAAGLMYLINKCEKPNLSMPLKNGFTCQAKCD